MFYLAAVLSYSIIGAVIIGAMNYKRVLPTFRPFILFLCIALGNEVLSSLVIYFYHTNIITGNIYVLVESLLLIRMFKAWTIHPGAIKRFNSIMVFFVIAWLCDNVILHRPDHFSAAFRVVYSTVLVFVAIEQINQVIIFERDSILRNPKFLIASAILVFYMYKSLLEVFFMFETHNSKAFNNTVFLLLALFNLLSNIIYAVATLCLPSKQKLSLPY
jgi:hypothetical protein